MAQPFVGEIRLFAGNFPPAGWMFCDGQLMPISENETLFQLIGTTYGGDGEETFALPNLQSRLPIHQGTGPGLSGRTIGEMGGTESVTLTVQQIPVHNHAFLVSTDAATGNDAPNNVLGTGNTVSIFKPLVVAPAVPMAAQSITPVGGSQPHDNMQPFLVVSYIISLFGLFPRFS
ncbi:MAG TPA: tail fiber protein [Allosphingosinicella sp.]